VLVLVMVRVEVVATVVLERTVLVVVVLRVEVVENEEVMETS
jgi:hypothetical protein